MAKPLAKVTVRGCVEFAPTHFAQVFMRTKHTVLMTLEMCTKYPEVVAVGADSKNVPSLHLTGTPDTLYLREGSHPSDITSVEFPRFVGWDFWGMPVVSKYSIYLTLFRIPKEK